MTLLLGTFAVVLGFGISSQSVNAEVRMAMKPGETGDIYYDASNVYTMSGTKHGSPWSDATAAMAVSPDNGSTDSIVFCIEPGVPFFNTNNPDYEAVEVQDVPQDAQIASVIWNTFYAFGTSFTTEDRIVTQAVIWELLPQYGIKVNSIDRIPDFQAKKQKLYDGIKDYKRLPEFNKKTIDLTFGKTTHLTSSVDLNTFETQVSNTAKVKWDVAADGKSVDVAPTDANVTGGSIAFKRSFMEGTPIALEKEGSQTVYLPSVKDPTNYVVNFKINTTGDITIKKVDKETNLVVPNTKFKVEFSGTGAPETKTVTTDKDGLATIKGVTNGVHVKATETNVPAPYILGSTIGDSDVVEGDVVAGKEITLTQRNVKATGQIVVDKKGVETDNNMWNNNYTLKGNVFEIHEDTEKGKVIATITTDDKGYAETKNDLPLGTYVVTEKTASNGFTNTFKPVEVKIEYKDQKTAIVVENAKGTNQEVVGSAVLTKEDAETANETQGKASFIGAQYGLFYENGTPVKWSDSFKPKLTNGTKVKGDEIVIEIDEKDQTAGVEHLALGKYFWKELKAPEGYQIDKTKRSFALTYKDQTTQNIVTEQLSKENVIKFSLDGFKYVESKTGNVNSGYNGIDFTLTPQEPTKGEQRKVTTETDNNGYDGYWAFNEVPYGDYVFSEVEAPEGYEKLKDLTIQSSFDAEKREYTFTITEDGQKEPIKVKKVSQDEINEGSNVIHLSKLFLTNKVEVLPEIRTKATVNGEKTFTPATDTPMQDVVTITNAKKDVEYTNQIKLWRLVNDDVTTAEVVWSGEHDFVAKGDSEEDVIGQMIDTSKDDNTVSYVFTEELFIKDGPKVAEHNDLENKDQTIRPFVPGTPTIETLFITKDGDKTFDPTKDQELVDKVNATVPKEDIGKTFYYVTEFHKIDKDGKDTVVGTEESEHTADKEDYEFDAVMAYKADTLKDGEKLVATHIVYSDKEHEEEYAKHFDLTNEKQTLVAVTPEMPTIETLFVTKDGDKTFDPTKDQELVDKVVATVPKEDIGKTFYYVTQFHKIDKDGKDTVVGTSESEHEADKENYEFDAKFAYKADTLKDGEKLVATHIAYTDKEHEEEYAKHYDLSNEKQTLTAKTPKTPETLKAETPKPEKTLPQTAGTLLKKGSLIVLALGLIAGITVYVRGQRKYRR
ncbi:SpaA isopeptide-forming pilin-related protein [Enterococcus thailandicus]|uniref:SpaA isopeptide-forming pilin-related protein n=1 Tax=Enterococcus thailandicus TaxID=417368 RepID=UPI0035E259C7